MRLGAQVDLVLIAMIAEEQHLAAVGDQDQRVVGKGHKAFPPCDLCQGERGPKRTGCTGLSHDCSSLRRSSGEGNHSPQGEWWRGPSSAPATPPPAPLV